MESRLGRGLTAGGSLQSSSAINAVSQLGSSRRVERHSRSTCGAITAGAVFVLTSQFEERSWCGDPTTSLTFTAILHALNAYFGAVGKFLGLVLLILQLISSGGTFPWQTLPDVLYPLHLVLPMGYVVDGLRHLLYGGAMSSLGTDVLVLVGYLVGALAVSTVAASRQRVWTPARLKPELVL